MGTDYGSGYPGDPATKAWLSRSCIPIFGFPSTVVAYVGCLLAVNSCSEQIGLVRFSWSTTKKILLAKGPEVTWEDDGDDDDDEEAASTSPTPW
jgi:ribonuclease H2 subunit A